MNEAEKLVRSKLVGEITADERGVFNTVNDDMLELFGYSRKEMVGACLTLIQPHRFRAGHAKGFRHFVETRQSIGLLNTRAEVFGLHKTGYEFPISVKVTVKEEGGRLLFRNEIHDITMQREAERGKKFVEGPVFTDLYTILLVESEFAAQEAMIGELRANRIANRIIVVNSVAEALDFAFSRNEYAGRAAVPYVVLLSVIMPEVNGLEFLRALRDHVPTRHVPVAITTILPRNEEMDALINLGNCEYIQKPIKFNDVTRVLNALDLSWVIGRRV